MYFWYESHSITPKLGLWSSYLLEKPRFATGFSNISHMNNVNLTPVDVPMLCGLIASVVQIFFAHRIYTLRRGYWVICCLIVLVRALLLSNQFEPDSLSDTRITSDITCPTWGCNRQWVPGGSTIYLFSL